MKMELTDYSSATTPLFRRSKRLAAAASKLLLLPRSGTSRGQSAVEFAIIAPIALVVMLIGIQFALIGQAALAVSQASFLGARTASVDGTLTSATLSTAISNQMSPTISGATVTLTPGGAASCGPPRTFGCPFTVAVTYDASSKIFLPSSTLLGITFPTNLTFTESAMTE
jgi:Flp pilus assembly protein TadG